MYKYKFRPQDQIYWLKLYDFESHESLPELCKILPGFGPRQGYFFFIYSSTLSYFLTVVDSILLSLHGMFAPCFHKIVVQKMLRARMMWSRALREKKIGYDDSFDVIKCLQKIEIPVLLHMCAKWFEQPSNMKTMICIRKWGLHHLLTITIL